MVLIYITYLKNPNQNHFQNPPQTRLLIKYIRIKAKTRLPHCFSIIEFEKQKQIVNNFDSSRNRLQSSQHR